MREVLADFRPNLAARRAFARTFGEETLDDLPAVAITARWREEHVLAGSSLALVSRSRLPSPHRRFCRRFVRHGAWSWSPVNA
jgi:hypothetical protein